ncbi:type 1 glutamine amidotransferase [Pseudooceanicola atlanticus]|uniref:Glutamine amidotransferase n=1 Tax=Pseudooceanicola atlanticus TaxID=1461694 RepID=A0A0A0EGZ8_9RHOB|nr:type 1 glutamine amidotransferase [Pseudooceanicola atlanticus]KGM48462.1 glutamine amidotransferase [Pseudooceanicola atlanticus]
MLIGILQCGHFPEDLQGESGDYDAMFERLLAGENFDYATYNVVDGDFPEGPEACDGWLITGSRHGAYEDHDWIPPLEDLIRAIRDAGRPLVGVCFGHQIIAQALGGKVVKFDGGWSVGAQTYQFEDGPLTLNAWHQDQVVALPDGAQVLASSEFCANAAVAYGDRIYTVQAHPEFTATEVDGLIRKRGPGVVPDALLANAADNLNAPLGSSTIAKRFAATFRGEK